MSSWITTERARRLDQAVFYLAFGGALAAAVFTVGAAANRTDLAVTGAELILAGTAVSWWLRRWPLPRALGVGLVLGMGAGVLWLLRVKLSGGLMEEADASIESSMAMAFYMSILLVVASYALVRAEIAAFALIPGLSMMGLAAGQGDESVARLGFTVYLPLALLAVGYAMLATGAVAGARHRLPEEAGGSSRGLHWQVRHWPTLVGVILVVMLLAEALYLPLQAWASAHRWQLITAMASPSTITTDAVDVTREAPSTYRVGKGALHPDDTPVLTVVGDYAAYWRGEVYDTYNGASWGQSGAASPQIELPPSAQYGAITFSVPSERRPTSTYRVTAEVTLPLTFYAPGEVYRVVPGELLEIPADARVIMNGYEVARIPGALLYPGSTYQVTSDSFESPVGRATSGRPGDRFLRVPLGVSRTAEVAREVAGAEPTAEKKMMALIGYLQNHCTYSLDAPSVPLGNDAVEYFLFHQQTGACDLFASALAIMGRAVGVPTRFVTGYAFPTASSSGTPQSYVLTHTDAHAWVEAFLPESGGWTMVDATPAAKAASSSRGWWKQLAFRMGALWRTHPVFAAGYVLTALLLVLAFAFAVRSLVQYRRTEALPAVGQDWRAEMARLYLRLCRLLRRRGCSRHASQTPLEYLAHVEQHWSGGGDGAALPLVRTLTQEFVVARYGPGPVTEETARAARDTLAALRRALGRRR